MTLDPGTHIGRYEIRSSLGAGAMGQVYLAYDSELRRSVALKLINQTSDEERVRRFRNEVRVISSLSHPNLLTLYDVGQYNSLPFIVTEFIRGESLRQRMAHGPIELLEALDIAIQIANGLRAAHESGIIHRDIKPENVMVLPDGYVKILDFGLAKLRNPPELIAPSPQVSTVSLIDTDSGVIVGTVNYMSPEQLRGQNIDERTDIWSLGVVLYELLSRRRPFQGESVSDVIAAILDRSASPLSTSVPETPVQLEAVIDRALRKNKEERYRTADEFAADLKLTKQVVESRTEATGNSSRKTNPASRKEKTRHFKVSSFKWILVLILAVFGFFLWQGRIREPVADRVLRFARLFETTYNSRATISPDGRWYAFVHQEADGSESLRLGQVNVAGWQVVVPAERVNYRGMTFTPDGNWIYFLVFGLKTNTTSGTLFRITTLGSFREEVMRNVDSPITFSPDGQRFAFLRSLPETGRDQLIIYDLTVQSQRVISEQIKPRFFCTQLNRETPSWSPSGKFIATPIGNTDSHGDYMTIVAIDIESGAEKPLTSRKWLRIGPTQWLKDGGLIVSAAESGTELYQLYKISSDGGEVTPLHPDFSDYSNLSISDNGRLLAVPGERRSGISLLPTDEQTLGVSLATHGGEDGLWGFSWTPNGDLVFVSLESRNRDIWIRDINGQHPPRQLTFDNGADYLPTVSQDGRYIVFLSNRTGALHVWRMNMDGADVKQLTHAGEEKYPQITNDSKWVIYSSRTTGSPSLWKVSIDGGEPVRITDRMALWPSLSPDGKWIACVTKPDSIDQPMELGVFSVADFSLQHLFKMPAEVATPEFPAVIRWFPDSRAFAYVVTQKGVSNIFSQPLSGKPKKITNFTADRIFWFDWFKDGKRLAIARGVARYTVVIIEDF
jgi:eukaryotic-like serine/threonine-protein kinase